MITPPCSSPGCKQPSVHIVVTGHYCVPCYEREIVPYLRKAWRDPAYERKVWGKA